MGSDGATSSSGDALRSPLHDRHLALGAKLALFAGWQMPLEYAGGGVLKEHTAVRESVGVFDVSHLGKAKVSGPGAAAFLNQCLTADLDRAPVGHAQYTLCCDDESGGVIDDLIAYRFGADDVTLIPNAANTAEVVRRLAAAAPPGVEVRNQHRELAVLAVQGPGSAALLDGLGMPTSHPYLSFVLSGDAVVCRTGYTGEHGYELLLPVAGAPAVWDALIAAGAQPCGLGARDTLRTEMGYALHGQDLSPLISPVQARVGWAVGWSKPEFWGRAALAAERATGPARLLWGIEALDRGIPRPRMAVLAGEDRIGEVTSGTFSPTRRVGIGLALLDTSAGIAEGDEVAVDVRGRLSRVRVVKPPFVPSHVR